MNTFLDKIGLQRLWGKIKALVPTKVSELENDSGYITDKEKEYLSFVALESGAFGFTHSVDGAVLYYSKNDGEWTALTGTVDVVKGDVVRFKGELTPNSSNGIGTFSSTGQFDVEGNVMSLLFGDDFKGQTDLTRKNYVFCKLFLNNTNLVSAKNLSLPATTLANYCYDSMFNGCTSIVEVPQLPATTLKDSCYQHMFEGCTSIVNAPQLPAKTLAIGCYHSMFRCCTGLTTAPELPATRLETNCYQHMFRNCTSLNYIKAMFTTNPGSYTSYWVSGVASSGTFVKNSAATWNVAGISGIPIGWTVYTESEWEYAHKYELKAKQDTLVSGTNIKTINNQSLLGEGNITIEGGTQIPTIAFGTSTTAAATAQKDVSIPAITELNSGQIIIIKPTVTSTVKNSTIKLNSFTAYPMRYKNAAITVKTAETVWEANVPSTWVFDGTYWIFAGHGFDNDTTYYTMSGSESESSTTERLVTGSSLSSFIETYLGNHNVIRLTIDCEIDEFNPNTSSYSLSNDALDIAGPCVLAIIYNGIEKYLLPYSASPGEYPAYKYFTGIINNKKITIGLEYEDGFNIIEYNVTNQFSGSYNDLSDKPTIPAAVTESTVSGWGFTKNTGTYSKPSGGIPSSDLATAVQNALTAAGTALQPADLNTLNGKVAALESLVSDGDNPTAAIDKFNEIVAFLANITNTDTLNGILNGINEAIVAKYTKPSGGIPKTDLASAVQTSLGKADTALQSFTESDPTVPQHVKSITTTDISNWNSKVSNVQADWNATSGDAVILNKPTIPTKTSQLTNDSNFLTEDDVQRFFTGTQTISENQDIAGAKDGDIYMKTV